MAQRSLRAFFKTKISPKTFEEARNVYSFFASKGELLEFKFARDPDVKKIKDYGWISYKDNKITEQLLENWFKIEPFNTEAIVHRSDKEENRSLINQRSGSLPLVFGGFYLKNDKASSPSILDQTSNNLTSSKNNQGREDLTVEVIEETIEASENSKESSLTATTNFTKNIIENTITLDNNRDNLENAVK